MIPITIKEILKYWDPETVGERLVVVVAAIILVVALGIGISRSLEPVKPFVQPGPSSILILRESVVSDLRYGNVILIDYMVDGWQTNAYFRPGEEEKYEEFWAELEKLGEVQK